MATDSKNIMHKKYDRRQVINLLKRYPFIGCHNCIAKEECKIVDKIKVLKEDRMLYRTMLTMHGNVNKCVLAKMKFLVKITEEKTWGYRFD